MDLREFKSSICLSNDLDMVEAAKISDSLQEITKDWIEKLNHSIVVRKDMYTAMTALKESGDIDGDIKIPKLEYFSHNLTNKQFTVNIFKSIDESSGIICDKVIPTDLLANKLSKDSRVKDLKEVRAVSYTDDGNIIFEFNDVVPNDHTFLVREVYFGKSQNLISIEEKFTELRNTITEDQYGVFDTLPLVQDINALFEAQFGMDLFSLHLEPYPAPNAWTFTVGYMLDVAIDQSIRANGISATQRDGFRYKPNNGLCVVVCITTGLFNDRSISSEELVAILLHEIGHNFQDFIDPAMKAYDNTYILNRYDEMMAYCILNTMYEYKAEVLKYVSNWAYIEDRVSPTSERRRKDDFNKKKFDWDVKVVLSSISKLLNVVLLGIPRGIVALMQIPAVAIAKAKQKKKKEFFERTGEMAADKFPTVYGYGAAQQSALTKMYYNDYGVDKFINSIPLLSAYLALERIPGRMLVNIYDEHPSLIARIEDQIYTLEQELKKKNMSPALRKAIMKDLEQLKQNRDDITRVGKLILTDKAVENWWNKYLSDELDRETMEKVSKRLNEEMDAYIKKQKR